ncbi:MAG: PepSY domain-containing protein [Eubacterium sp.]|nr:PepSY domain-containing protein [Eubacterium sp.]
MKKNIIAIICGVVAAVVVITGVLVSTGKMKEEDSIGASAALTIALNDAGVGKEEAKNTSSNFEKENGVYVFEVEFNANSNEYEYEIDASTGEILKRDVEGRKTKENLTEKSETTTEKTTLSDEKQTTASKQKTTKQTTKAKTTKQSENIGIDAAKRIALNNAGVGASQVRFTKAKLDYDDGVAQYEIEFIKGNTEYEYEIDAKTGKIIDFDKETKSSDKDYDYDDDEYDDD